MPEIFELIARPGVERLLASMASSSEAAFVRTELENNLVDAGGTNAGTTVDDLIGIRLLQRIGVRFGLSHYGHRITLLIEAMNGGDLESIVRRLRRLDGSAELYELV